MSGKADEGGNAVALSTGNNALWLEKDHYKNGK